MRQHTKSFPSRLGFYTQKTMSPVFKARGLMEGKIITCWTQIVGEKMAEMALPETITFPKGQKIEGTLHLSVTSAGALMLHYAQDLILEQINRFFGYKALSKLRLTHGLAPASELPSPPPSKHLSEEGEEWLNQQTSFISDEELKACLEKLGAAIHQE